MMNKLKRMDITKNDVEEVVEKKIETEAMEGSTVSIEPTDKKESKSGKIWKVYDAAMNVALAIMIPMLTFILFFGSTHLIDGKSMDSTLSDGDYVISINSLNNVERGDIVIASPEQLNDRKIIKRVIALGGDTVSIDAGKVFVNGELIEENYVDIPAVNDFQEEVKIPEGYVWIMGDNRNNSLDSRRMGFVSVEDLDGLAIARLLPIKNIEMLK